MREEQLIGNGEKKSFRDLDPLFAGYEICEPKHAYGPHIREYYLLHYCRSGSGTFRNERGTFPVKERQIFVIRPGEITRYMADQAEPWTYIWIAIGGTYAKKLDTSPDVISFSGTAFEQIFDLIRRGEKRSEPYLSLLYDFFYRLQEQSQTRADICAQIKNYIDYHYMEEIGVEEIAALFGFDRRYLSRVFAHRYGASIKEYLVGIRMEKASRFLQEGHSVSDAAFFVGYRDPLNFSRMFKKVCGCPPSRLRCARPSEPKKP